MPSSETQPQLAHKTIKAAAVATDQGHFSAIAAAYSVDRMKERILPGAFEKTIAAWQASQKQIPLHWDHESAAESIVGRVDPASMEERADGLYVEGQLDLKASGIAREAWRSMKNNAVSLSFGYLAKTRKGKNGVTDITEIDLFEISVVPAPANADTRFLSLKALKGFKTIEDVQAFVGEKFPEYKIVSAVEDGGDEEPGRAKSAPQDPLVKEAWELVVPSARSTPPREPEPEPDEPLDAATVQREAWALALKTSGK